MQSQRVIDETKSQVTMNFHARDGAQFQFQSIDFQEGFLQLWNEQKVK